MTKWQLPQGVEYPIGVDHIQSKVGIILHGCPIIKIVMDEIGLNQLIYANHYFYSDSIRINNSIDLVKIEE